MIVIHEVIDIKVGCFLKIIVLKFNMLKTKISPRKLLRRLIKNSVVCFVSTGGEKIWQSIRMT